MGEADHQGGRQNAALDELLHDQSSECLRRLTARITGGIDKIRLEAYDAEGRLHTRCCDGLLDTAPKPVSLLPEAFDHMLSAVHLNRRDCRGQAQGLRTMRGRLEKHAIRFLLDSTELPDISSSEQAPDPKPIT